MDDRQRLHDLMHQVSNMRNLQKKFFRLGKEAPVNLLQSCKDAERRVDVLVKDYFERGLFS